MTFDLQREQAAADAFDARMAAAKAEREARRAAYLITHPEKLADLPACVSELLPGAAGDDGGNIGYWLDYQARSDLAAELGHSAAERFARNIEADALACALATVRELAGVEDPNSRYVLDPNRRRPGQLVTYTHPLTGKQSPAVYVGLCPCRAEDCGTDEDSGHELLLAGGDAAWHVEPASFTAA